MFDLVVWTFLIITGVVLVDLFLHYRWRVKKRRRLVLLITSLLSLAWLLVFYGSFVEPRMLLVKHENVSVLNNSIRAALISDIHVGPYKRSGWVEKIVKIANREKPDVIFLLGDYIMGVEGKVEDLLALGQLEAPLGVFAILGNHDYQNNRSAEVETALKNLGITVLRNSSTKIVLSDGSDLFLAGVGDFWYDGMVSAAVDGLSSSDQVILLAHNPDTILDSSVKIADLVLSGHTHGGQIRLPFFGAMFVPTKIGEYFGKGKFLINGISLFITSGTGEMGPRARLFNPPEVAVLEL